MMARAHLVNPSVTRWYHCATRCVRRAFFLTEERGEDPLSRKEWIEHRLEELGPCCEECNSNDSHMKLIASTGPRNAAIDVEAAAERGIVVAHTG
jgi:hypothetical protein